LVVDATQALPNVVGRRGRPTDLAIDRQPSR
jgi:hypothetical protein